MVLALPTPTTELIAVNNMLIRLNETMVTVLGSNQSTMSVRAETILATVNREVQLKGWAFNLDFPVTLSEAAGVIAVPSDSLWVKVPQGSVNQIISTPTLTGREHIVERARKLWQRAAQTFTFQTGDSVANVTVCRGLAYEDLPEVARQYIYARALRMLSGTIKPNQLRDAQFRADELNAHGELLEQEGMQDNLTIFDNPSTYQALDRKNPASYGPSWR